MSDGWTKEQVTQVQNERALFQRVLVKDADGASVLAWIGNECGAFSQDPALVRPELIAMWNRLLGKCGIVHPENLVEIAEKLGAAANNNDLANIRAALKKTGGSDG